MKIPIRLNGPLLAQKREKRTKYFGSPNLEGSAQLKQFHFIFIPALAVRSHNYRSQGKPQNFQTFELRTFD